MSRDRIVAVGLLTSTDLKMLGERFQHYFPVEPDDLFADLLARLDEFEAVPVDAGVAIRRIEGGCDTQPGHDRPPAGQ